MCEEIWHQIVRSDTMWIEPIWKMVLSNKGILPILWELNPEHPNLLPTTFDAPSDKMWGWAKKPLLSREGANVTIKTAARRIGCHFDTQSYQSCRLL